MKTTLMILTMTSFLGCTYYTKDDPNKETTQELQSVQSEQDSGTITPEFRTTYSEQIFTDEPIIYLPLAGQTWNQTDDNFIDINSTDLDNLSTFSIEFWFEPNTEESSYEHYSFTVFSNRQKTPTVTGLGFYWQDQNESFMIELRSDSVANETHEIFDADDLLEGSNHVVIAAQDSSGNFIFYLNGNLVKTINYSNYTPMSNGPFRIGAQIATPGYMSYIGGEDISHYTGELDNFAIYDYELTRDDVLQHYVTGYDLFSR